MEAYMVSLAYIHHYISQESKLTPTPDISGFPVPNAKMQTSSQFWTTSDTFKWLFDIRSTRSARSVKLHKEEVFVIKPLLGTGLLAGVKDAEGVCAWTIRI